MAGFYQNRAGSRAEDQNAQKHQHADAKPRPQAGQRPGGTAQGFQHILKNRQHLPNQHRHHNGHSADGHHRVQHRPPDLGLHSGIPVVISAQGLQNSLQLAGALADAHHFHKIIREHAGFFQGCFQGIGFMVIGFHLGQDLPAAFRHGFPNGGKAVVQRDAGFHE